jgi:aspartyl-tRNA(Asn)/glutamyl-tRNA(Gln) amidotransferase subunit B
VNHSAKYELVVGLEVHAQLQTQTKLFCSDLTAFGAEPNTQVSPVSLALPGTLPVINKKAIELAVKLGLALNCTIQHENYFARKHYFYPDLPKGYQISQHTAPICEGGYLEITVEDEKMQIALNRIHLEEDAGKSIHDADERNTCIDLNRAGIPLLEIVTEPIHSPEAAHAFLTELRRMLRWLDVCDGNMEEGSMRCDANISIRLKGDQKLGTRVEIKNLNSIRNVKKAIELEMQRQTNCIEKNEPIIQQTRSFDADKQISFPLRNKEEADDYRYFPEPDLPPFVLSETFIDEIRSGLPLLPQKLIEKYKQDFGLSEYDANAICQDKEEVAFYESLVTYLPKYKNMANWMLGPIKQYTNDHQISILEFPLSPLRIAEIVSLTESGTIHFNTASTRLLSGMIKRPGLSALDVATELNLMHEQDGNTLQNWVSETLNAMPDKVKAYHACKKALIGLFAGEVKKRSKGKADMEKVQQLLIEKLQQNG